MVYWSYETTKKHVAKHIYWYVCVRPPSSRYVDEAKIWPSIPCHAISPAFKSCPCQSDMSRTHQVSLIFKRKKLPIHSSGSSLQQQDVSPPRESTYVQLFRQCLQDDEGTKIQLVSRSNWGLNDLEIQEEGQKKYLIHTGRKAYKLISSTKQPTTYVEDPRSTVSCHHTRELTMMQHSSTVIGFCILGQKKWFDS